MPTNDGSPTQDPAGTTAPGSAPASPGPGPAQDQAGGQAPPGAPLPGLPTAGSASGQAQQTGDQSSAPGGQQVADVFQRAPSTSQALGAPMGAYGRSALDDLRDDQPDHPLVSATPANEEPRGDQALPALMTPGGSLPVVMTPGSHAQAIARIVSSPTATPQDLGVGQPRYKARHILPREHLETMNRAEIRAVAADRGYDVGDTGGRRVMIARFLEAQDEDKGLESPDAQEEEEEVEEASTADTAPTSTTGAGEGGRSTDQASGSSQ